MVCYMSILMYYSSLALRVQVISTNYIYMIQESHVMRSQLLISIHSS